jgi:MFS family permease
MATEHATAGRRGFYSSFPQMGPAVGFLLSSGLFLILTASLSESQFASWGWRIPFLFSVVLVAIGLYVRVAIAETPVFREAMETRARVPFFDMVRTYPLVLLLSSGGITLAYVLFYTSTTFLLSYGTDRLGLPSTTLLYCTMIAVAIMGLGVPVFAALSDRVGRRSLCLLAAALTGIWAFLPELYGTRLRYSGAAVSYNLGGVFGGAFAPLIAGQLLASTGGSWSISLYVLAMAAVSFVCISLLSEIRAEERRLVAEAREPAAG